MKTTTTRKTIIIIIILNKNNEHAHTYSAFEINNAQKFIHRSGIL